MITGFMVHSPIHKYKMSQGSLTNPIAWSPAWSPLVTGRVAALSSLALRCSRRLVLTRNTSHALRAMVSGCVRIVTSFSNASTLSSCRAKQHVSRPHSVRVRKRAKHSIVQGTAQGRSISQTCSRLSRPEKSVHQRNEFARAHHLHPPARCVLECPLLLQHLQHRALPPPHPPV
jgi:hypothetical protein